MGAGAVARPASTNIAWTVAAPLPTAVAETGGGAATGNFFWTAGGYDATFTVTNKTQQYNKGTNAWATKAPIPGAGGGWADAAFCWDPVGKKLHVVNGHDGSFLYAAHQVFDPLTNTWSFLAFPMLASGDTYFSQDSGCAFIGEKMYLFGGYGVVSPTPGIVGIQRITWVYDPATDTWTDTGRLMVVGRLWQGYTNNATTAFAAAGLIDLTTGALTDTTEKFNPAGGWVASAVLPKALYGVGEGVAGTHLVVWGGADAGFVAQNKTYGCTLPACGAWATTAFNLPVAKGFGAFGSGSSLYSAGGYDSSGAVLGSAEHLP